MEITVEKVMEPVPVAVIAIIGDLDASNYLELVAKAQNVYQTGVQNILLDLEQTSFVSSAGLVALHSIALLLRGEQPLDPEAGWESIHAMDRNLSDGMQEHIKLLNPQPRVDRTLERTGLKGFFHIFTDRQAAMASFKAEGAQTPVE
jgi:anti-anti-sigma regulatory factor